MKNSTSNDNFLITLPRPGGFPGRGVVLCLVAKGGTHNAKPYERTAKEVHSHA